MRGNDQQPNSMFSYVSPEQRVPKDHPLRAIRQLVDDILSELSREVDRLYAKVGRPSIPPGGCCDATAPDSLLDSQRAPADGAAR